MKRTLRLALAVGAGLVLSLGAIAPVTATASAAPKPAPAAVQQSLSTAAPDLTARLDAARERLGLPPSPAAEALERVINPGDYQCGPTQLDAYVDQLISGMTLNDIIFLITSGALDFPTYDALLFGSDSDSRYALHSHATQLQHSFRDVKNFWDIDSSDIQLHAMHGDMLLDQARVKRISMVLLGMTDAQATAHAALVVDTVKNTPAFDGGNNPLFTLNAFAFTAEGDPDPLVQGVPDKLIFGDGILDALDAMGVSDVGPRAVMGHEFGHHIQFEDGLFSSPLTGAEATRRTELMADAFGTYFAVHSRGLSLNAKRVLDAQKTFFEVGDCFFDDPGHHGTPNQRLRSAQWAAGVAQAARPQGKVLPSLTFAQMFEDKLPELVAPDA